jgi:hypothetical protein
LFPLLKKGVQAYDATALAAKYDGPPLNILIDQVKTCPGSISLRLLIPCLQGTEDKFFKEKQLLPEDLLAACAANGVPVGVFCDHCL